MKRILICSLALLLFLSGCQSAPVQDAPPSSEPAASAQPAEDPAPEPTAAPASEAETGGLLALYESDPAAFSCVATGAFSADELDAPSDEELLRMLNFAMAMGSAHQLTPSHFIVIRDAEEQRSIHAPMGDNVAGPGTVTVLALADTLRAQEYHEEPYNDWYSQMYYGIFDAGSAFGYLNLAAYELGYKTHFYAALNIPVDGVVDATHGGRFSLIEKNNWDIEKYTTSKDGTVDFTHTVGTYDFVTGPKNIEAGGNLSLLCTMVIGKPDASLDAVSSATQSTKPGNYNFWDPQDGSTYGSSVPAGESPAAQQDGAGAASANAWENLPDGTYSGKGKSDSSQYTVEAVIQGGKIHSIKIAEGREAMFSDDAAIDGFIQSIVNAQSLAVDTIAGATQDCQGIISALNEAFS